MKSTESTATISGHAFVNDMDVPSENDRFSDFHFRPEVMEGIRRAGFEQPTPIQAETIPAALAGRDVIGLAQTGSGKTVAFALPALQRMQMNKKIEVLILTPTRELAHQVADECRRLGGPLGVNVVTVVGGEPIYRQAELANRGGGIIVATPGRLIDHLSNKNIKHFAPHTIVLDEADEMLDMGFIDSINEIKSFLPKQRQTLMFSATMGKGVRDLAKAMLRDPVQVSLTSKGATHADIQQKLYVIEEKERESALMRLIDAEAPSKAIVFCRTRQSVDQVCEKLLSKKINAKAIHGDMSQPARNAAMKSLSKGHIQLLVATDVASRGLDISDLSHVFNFHLPCSSDRYTHRIGRTGRAGKKGVAITLASPREVSSNDLFRHKKLSDFELSSLPTRKQVIEQRAQSLVADVNVHDIDPESVKICRELYKSGIGFDFMCRMFSMLHQQIEMGGPEKIGYRAEDIASMRSSGSRFDRPMPGRGKAQSRSRSKFGRSPQKSGKPFSKSGNKSRPQRGISGKKSHAF